MMCTEEYVPVCGTNRETYSNMCFLDASVCNLKHTFTFMHNGACVGSKWENFVQMDTDHSASVSPAEFVAGVNSSQEKEE